MSSFTDKCLSFFRLLRKIKKVKWTKKCQKAFYELNKYLSSPPLLARPKLGDKLQVYLATIGTTVNIVFIRKKVG